MTAAGLAVERRRAMDWLLFPVAPAAWNGLLRVSGAVALAGILVSSFVPVVSELAVLFSLTVLTNGPYSMFLPVAFEPVLMVFARVYPAVLVAAIGTAGAVAVEYVNYRLYDAALRSRLMAGMRGSGLVRRLVIWFGRQPFFTVFMAALTPIPFWVARIAGVLDGYSVRRFLVATAMGRFPRFLFYAALGTVLPLTSAQVLAAGAAATVILGAAIALRRQGGREPLQAI